ncbi:MAG: AEC family transporter [Pseudomonadota bacterium]|nr:AEC family transporter [Pseudomonadota bacterium]
MFNLLAPYAFFILLGIFWQFSKPNGITAESLRSSINTAILRLLLPLVVFFTIQDLPLNDAALKILLYVIATSLITVGVAWFWLSKTSLPANTKGAYLIAATFGSVVFLGMPLNKALFSDWTMRVAIEYMLVANVLVLFTAGAIFAKHLAGPARATLKDTASVVFNDYPLWLKEPLVWAAVAGWLMNIVELDLASWAVQISRMLEAMLIPLLLFSVGLSLKWQSKWQGELAGLAPVVVIKLLLVPVIMWAMAYFFGSAGVQTTKSLIVDSMMPATAFGFLMCHRYKLDMESYSLAFTATSVLALLTVPAWYNVLL